MNKLGADDGRAGVAGEAGLGPRMVDVGGRRLAFISNGTGAPTVVLETGLGADSSEWALVERGVAPFTGVCRYDRAGRGSSDAAPTPRTALDMVDDLHTLLRVADVPRPYVLVGHSFGGLLARLYAHRYGRLVAGLVLVDAMHEDQFDVFGPLFPPAAPSDGPALSGMRAFWTGGWRDPDATTERINFAASTAQAREVASLGSIPVYVLTAGTFLNYAIVPPDRRSALQQRWELLQGSYRRLSSCVTHSFVRSSGHFIQRDNPQSIIAVIQRAVAGARRLTIARRATG